MSENKNASSDMNRGNDEEEEGLQQEEEMETKEESDAKIGTAPAASTVAASTVANNGNDESETSEASTVPSGAGASFSSVSSGGARQSRAERRRRKRLQLASETSPAPPPTPGATAERANPSTSTTITKSGKRTNNNHHHNNSIPLFLAVVVPIVHQGKRPIDLCLSIVRTPVTRTFFCFHSAVQETIRLIFFTPQHVMQFSHMAAPSCKKGMTRGSFVGLDRDMPAATHPTTLQGRPTQQRPAPVPQFHKPAIKQVHEPTHKRSNIQSCRSTLVHLPS